MSNKAIFLDRDDTLIEDPGYINNPDQVKLLDGVAEALVELRAIGYKLIVVSNQSAVARGIVSEKVLGEIHDRLRQLLAEKGAYLDKIYYCPYHPDGVITKYRRESDLRKPNPGMLLTAADEMDLDLGQSWCIGDSGHDVEAGLRAGCKTILITSHQKPTYGGPGEPSPDHKAVNIKEAVNIIKQHQRSFLETEAQTQTVPKPEPQPQIKAAEQQDQQQAITMEQKTSDETTEQLLSRILEQLKIMQRADMFAEFSIMRLLAGLVQILVLFCLLATIWLLMNPTSKDNVVFTALGFAIVLQLMSLTFYTIQARK